MSTVYADYAEREGYRVAFLKDFRVGDSVRVDATLIEATTDSAWDVLKEDFGVQPIPEEFREVFENNPSVTHRLVPKHDPQLPMDTVPERNDLVVLSPREHTLCVFHTTSRTAARHHRLQHRTIIQTTAAMKRTLLLGAMLCALAAMTACKNGQTMDNTANNLDRETHDALLGEWRAVRYQFYQDTLTDANSNVFVPDDPRHDCVLGDSTIIYRFLPSDTVTILLNSGTGAFCENRLAWSVKGDSICFTDTDYTTRSHIDTLTADRLVLTTPNDRPSRPANVLTLVRME